jgi:hypothetical protein
MTINYALTRAEIARVFFYALGRSPKFLITVMTYPIALGAIVLVTSAFRHALTFRDGVAALVAMLAAFCVVALWATLRGKTGERTMDIAERGISTRIGALSGYLPWSRVKAVTETGQYIFIVGSMGNAFLIPGGAFSHPRKRADFLAEIDQWRKTGR